MSQMSSKQMREFVLLITTVLLIVASYIGQLFWILPALYPSNMIIQVIMLIVFLESLVSLWLVGLTDTSIRGHFLPSILLPGWQYCYDCQSNRPPRAGHCYQCGVCVLKRDHHCAYTGCCIGYSNQRYFIILLIWGFFGCLFATFNNMSYFFNVILEGGSINPAITVMFVFLPMLAKFCGLVPVPLLFAMHYTLCFYCTATCAFFLGYQFFLIYRGQTAEEWRLKDFQYATKMRFGRFFRNWSEVFGHWNILAALLLPIKAPAMPANGLFTDERLLAEHVKFM